jgi:hypothetical protein
MRYAVLGYPTASKLTLVAMNSFEVNFASLLFPLMFEKEQHAIPVVIEL